MFNFSSKLKTSAMLFIIFGLVLGCVGFFLIRSSKKADNKSLTISMLDETNIRNLKENHESLSNSFGKNSFNLYVKLYGDAYAEKALKAEYSDKECVYYSVKVERAYEELVTKTDSNNKTTKNWVRKNETVLDKSYYSDGFGIRDGEETIGISHHNLDIDTVESYSHFEASEQIKGSQFSIAGISFNTGPSIRTIGFKYLETIVPLGKRLFVVGHANDQDGKLMISKPAETDKPFMVSMLSESEILNGLNTASKNKKIGGMVVLILGIGLLIFGIMKKIEVL